MVTGQGGLATAIAAVRAGAFDFVTKPVNVDVLALAVMRAIDQLSLQTLLKQLRDAEGNDVEPDGITGASPAIQRTIEMISRVADGGFAGICSIASMWLRSRFPPARSDD